MEPARGHGLEDARKAPGGPGHRDALVGGIVGEMELAEAEGEHRGIPGGQVELPGIDLGEIGEQVGGGGAFVAGVGCRRFEQCRVGQMGA